MAALNLELTDRVPRVEYSADTHWAFVKEVTGIDTEVPANRKRARREFIRLWDYAFLWATDIGNRFFEDPDRFGRLVDAYYNWVKQFYDAYAGSNVPVIMSHDDICWSNGPFAHPDWYRRYIFPYYRRLWTPIKEAGKKLLFTSDGDYTIFFNDIVECGADALVMEPLSDMALFANRYGKTHGFVGNADARVLMRNSKEGIYREVERCMEIGKSCPGFIMAVGNHIPQNTPVDNALYYNEAYRKLSQR